MWTPLWVNGMLRPNGELTVLFTSLTEIPDGERVLLRATIILMDQAGIQWRLIGMDYRDNLQVHNLPEKFEARYVLVHRHREFDCPIVYSIDAESPQDARDKLRKAFVIYEDKFTEWYVDYASTQEAKGHAPASRDLLGSFGSKSKNFQKLEK
jgi:hypothetical protein